MPGHMLLMTCECGLEAHVQPGVSDDMKSWIIYYDAEKETFGTMEETEANNLGIKAFPDPFIEDPTKFIFEVEGDIKTRLYQCPKCQRMKFRYHFFGHWDGYRRSVCTHNAANGRENVTGKASGIRKKPCMPELARLTSSVTSDARAILIE